MQLFGGKQVHRWRSIWTSGVDLQARYRQARLAATLPDCQRLAEKRQVRCAVSDFCIPPDQDMQECYRRSISSIACSKRSVVRCSLSVTNMSKSSKAGLQDD